MTLTEHLRTRIDHHNAEIERIDHITKDAKRAIVARLDVTNYSTDAVCKFLADSVHHMNILNARRQRSTAALQELEAIMVQFTG